MSTIDAFKAAHAHAAKTLEATRTAVKRRSTSPALDEFAYRPFSRPRYTDSQLAELRRAARAHADANRSDPFAYGRAMCHLTEGVEIAANYLADAGKLGRPS